jgi:glycine betaine/proline transport system substrate-binding protein
VNEDLRNYDPEAYAFMDALTLNEEQLNNLESTINEEGDPLVGARVWAESNREVWQPWVEAARGAQES